MSCMISIIIPNRNGEATIGPCLEAIFASAHSSFEVIVVDDNSEDDSTSIIRKFPCRLIKLSSHSGAARARNIGADSAQGEIIFFTDADCVILPDTLSRIDKNWGKYGKKVIIGGTYTCKPYDGSFFSMFQSVFVHYSEVKNRDNPDYIATHAMAISMATFRRSGGFAEEFYLPIVEDVEYSHRLQRQGLKLIVDPGIQVRHIFNFSLLKSVKNAFKKSKYWTIYSLNNHDLLKNSGCASHELKANVFSLVAILFLVFRHIFTTEVLSPWIIALPFLCNIILSHRLLKLYYKTGGLKVTMLASVYYTMIYSAAVGCGGLSGFITFVKQQKGNLFAKTPLPYADN